MDTALKKRLDGVSPPCYSDNNGAETEAILLAAANAGAADHPESQAPDTELLHMKTNRRLLPIARDGYRFLLPPLLVSLTFAVFQIWAPALLFLSIALCVAIFFRDPERRSPGIQGAILSPADGRVTAIEEVEHPDFPNGRAMRVSIFLSIFNVHVNRAPVKGEVASISYSPGKFLNAMADKSSDENEHNIIEFSNGSCRVLIKQIAGLIARRIVCSCETGQQVIKGQRIGLIRFGSRVDTFFDPNAEIKVKKGMTVKAGESVLSILDCPVKPE